MKFFIDLYHNNVISSLSALKNSGICGVILKNAEGANSKDPMFDKRVQEMKDTGIAILGVYFFYHPEDDSNAQADECINNLDGIDTVCIDLEWCEDANAWKKFDEITNEQNLKTFIARLVAANLKVKIYSSYNFIYQYLSKAEWLAAYDLWVADYSAHPFSPRLPTMWNKWWAWQYTGTGNVAGIVGPVDISYLNDGATV